MIANLKRTVCLVTLCALIIPGTALAATKTFDVTANSGSDSCTASAGSFAPSTLNVSPGDNVTVKFTVPANDPYSGGIEVRGFSETLTIPRGESDTVDFTANKSFNFSSYWPKSNCHKADGKVVVAGSGSGSTTPSTKSGTPAPAGAKTATPATGASDILGILGIALIILTGNAYIRSRKRLIESAKHTH